MVKTTSSYSASDELQESKKTQFPSNFTRLGSTQSSSKIVNSNQSSSPEFRTTLVNSTGDELNQAPKSSIVVTSDIFVPKPTQSRKPTQSFWNVTSSPAPANVSQQPQPQQPKEIIPISGGWTSTPSRISAGKVNATDSIISMEDYGKRESKAQFQSDISGKGSLLPFITIPMAGISRGSEWVSEKITIGKKYLDKKAPLIAGVTGVTAGIGLGLTGMIGGTASFIVHPIAGTRNLIGSITHPVQTMGQIGGHVQKVGFDVAFGEGIGMALFPKVTGSISKGIITKTMKPKTTIFPSPVYRTIAKEGMAIDVQPSIKGLVKVGRKEYSIAGESRTIWSSTPKKTSQSIQASSLKIFSGKRPIATKSTVALSKYWKGEGGTIGKHLILDVKGKALFKGSPIGSISKKISKDIYLERQSTSFMSKPKGGTSLIGSSLSKQLLESRPMAGTGKELWTIESSSKIMPISKSRASSFLGKIEPVGKVAQVVQEPFTTGFQKMVKSKKGRIGTSSLKTSSQIGSFTISENLNFAKLSEGLLKPQSTLGKAITVRPTGFGLEQIGAGRVALRDYASRISTKVDFGTRLSSITALSRIQKPMQSQRQSLMPIQSLKPMQSARQSQISRLSFAVPILGSLKAPKTVTTTVPYTPPIIPPFFPIGSSGKHQKSKFQLGKIGLGRYTPTMEAVIFNVKTTRAKIPKIITGLELRGMLR